MRPARRRGLPLPRASRTGHGASAVRRWLPAPAGVPYTVALAVHLYRGFPLPRASRSGRGVVRRAAMASRSRGRPVHGRVGRASVPWLPAPAGVPLRARRRPPCGYALPRVRPPAASPVRPCAGALLRPPHFHHSIWKANDKPAPPNVMISLRFPAAGAERGAPGAACSTAFAPRGRGFRRTESSAGQPRLLRPARTRFSRRSPRTLLRSVPSRAKNRPQQARPPCSPSLPGPRHAPFFGGVRQAPPRGRPGAFC